MYFLNIYEQVICLKQFNFEMISEWNILKKANISIYSTSQWWTGWDIRSSFMWWTAGLNSVFSFFYIGYLTKDNKSIICLPIYPWLKERWIKTFPKNITAKCEMQTASSKIWIWGCWCHFLRRYSFLYALNHKALLPFDLQHLSVTRLFKYMRLVVSS